MNHRPEEQVYLLTSVGVSVACPIDLCYYFRG